MGLNSLGFLIRECLLNIRRNSLMSVAALGTVTASLVVLGGAIWAAQRVHEVAEQQPSRLDQIDIFLKGDTEREKVFDFVERVRKLAGVKEARLVGKERAWKSLQGSEPTLTEAMPDNPLPDTVEIVPIGAKAMDSLKSALRDKSRFPEIEAINDASRYVRIALGFSRLVDLIGGGIAIGLFVATLFIVSNTIRLTVFARRREIRVMQLVGATSAFIRFPLLLEGLLYGLTGAVLAGGLLLLGSHEMSAFASTLQSPLLDDAPSRVGPVLVIGLLAMFGASIGLLGSHLSLRRFLRQV